MGESTEVSGGLTMDQREMMRAAEAGVGFKKRGKVTRKANSGVGAGEVWMIGRGNDFAGDDKQLESSFAVVAGRALADAGKGDDAGLHLKNRDGGAQAISPGKRSRGQANRHSRV